MRILGVTASGFYVSDPAMELIQTSILTSAQSAINFSNLQNFSSTYKHLQIRFSTYASTTANQQELVLRFNDSTSGYGYHELSGGGTNVTSGSSLGRSNFGIGYYSPVYGTPASEFGILDILDFASSTKNKTVRLSYGVFRPAINDSGVVFRSGAWFNTASITSITLANTGGSTGGSGISFPARFSLYGIKG
jgi:hypothetical protein